MGTAKRMSSLGASYVTLDMTFHSSSAPPCIQGDQMRPQLSPSNQGTMSSKETEWLEQRAGYSLEMEGGMVAEVERGGDEG
ncbi:Ferrochelatase [Dissostichus eleginoides]|uniref:Ferrochelatase n=1 Tax=Dissostichus eleginoides TaxID=100907 RepID=A0AAD9CNL7_DISEL|nr:Ferrochelatase [Dissostichus eleginoides]